MNSIFKLFVLLILFAVVPNRCLALRSIGILSAKEAKAIGVVIRATPAGPDAALVELEFKTEGKLKDYNPEHSSHVELEIREGAKSLLSYVALQEHRSAIGDFRVRFMVSREYLGKLILTIVVGDGARGGDAYELHVKDFVDAEKFR